MTKREKFYNLIDQYLNEYSGEIVLTLEWNMSIDQAIEFLQNREGREIIVIEEGKPGVKDAPLTYAYK